ncbi:MAG TPA: hypothetical protein VK446_00670 [Methylocystis sp.]|nr:hypothetical protein [Methylocystis sp.]
MSREETRASPRANPGYHGPTHTQPFIQLIEPTGTKLIPESIRVATPRGFARPINLERRARFGRFDCGGFDRS